MPNYQLAKIYKIVSNTDDDICYVGSTTKKLLCMRMAEHKDAYKLWKIDKYGKTSCFELFEKYGVENCRIELIEIFPCNSKDELNMKEGGYIRLLNCVNKNIAGRTRKEYRDTHKEKASNYHMEYRNINKSIIENRMKKPYTCCCGSTIRWGGKAKHEKSQKHLNYISSNTICLL
jgi:hypothetical protein